MPYHHHPHLLSTNDIQTMLALDGLMIIGTGQQHTWISQETLAPFYSQQSTVEIMNTHAACRTYTLLASENRPMVCALFL